MKLRNWRRPNTITTFYFLSQINGFIEISVIKLYYGSYFIIYETRITVLVFCRQLSEIVEMNFKPKSFQTVVISFTFGMWWVPLNALHYNHNWKRLIFCKSWHSPGYYSFTVSQELPVSFVRNEVTIFIRVEPYKHTTHTISAIKFPRSLQGNIHIGKAIEKEKFTLISLPSVNVNSMFKLPKTHLISLFHDRLCLNVNKS